jgi:class 3 adenylate cyclase
LSTPGGFRWFPRWLAFFDGHVGGVLYPVGKSATRHADADIFPPGFKRVASALWEQRDQFLLGGRPRPQQITATVLFSDIHGFTSVSEKLPPERLMDWLNEYMEAMSQIVSAHHGVVNKYIGDAVMALFGAPLARTDEQEIAVDAVRAVECALAMRQEIARLNPLWVAKGLPEISIRVGIYTGPLVAGS